MTATFNPSLTDRISRIRFKLGDTNTAAPEIEDESIFYFIGQGLTDTGAAATIAAAIAAKYAKLADTTVDDQLTRYSHVFKAWRELAEALQAEADKEAAVPNTTTPSYPAVIVTGLDDCRGPFKEWSGW